MEKSVATTSSLLTSDQRKRLAATDWASEGPTEPVPSLSDVQAARQVIEKYLTPTPLIRHPLLSRRAGCDLWVKLENAQPTGVFKIRGTLSFLARLPAEDRARGLVTATRGNFGNALARAAALHDVGCTIFVPEGNNPDKNEAIKATGARLIVQGHDFDAAWDASVRHARDTGAMAVHPAKHRWLVAGQGTVALEMLEQAKQPFDAVFVPVGGGSLAAGTGIVIKALSPQTQVIGVQAANAPAFQHAWQTGDYRPFRAAKTVADGLATRVPVRYTTDIMRDCLDDFVLVSEDEIYAAIRCYLETVHQLAEGGGAAPLAAALKLKDRFAGKRIGVVLSGCNIDRETLEQVLAGKPAASHAEAMPMYPISSLDYGSR